MALLPKVPKGGRVGVIGAGISGLSYAYFLTKLRPDVAITIFEHKPRTGGWINTVDLANKGSKISIEKGPRTIRGVSDGTLLILDSLVQNGYKDEIMVMKSTAPANKKYLLTSTHEIVQVPSSLSSFARFGQAGFLRGVFSGLLKEPFRKKGDTKDESIESFFKRRFGTTAITDNVVSAILHGIYAGNISKLSVKSLFPRLKDLEQEHGSLVSAMLKSSFKSISDKEHREKSKIKVFPEALKSYETHISPSSNLRKLSDSLKGYPIVALKSTLATYPQMLTEYLGKHPRVNFVFKSKVTQVDPHRGTIVLNGEEEHTFDHIRSTINVHNLASVLKWPQLANELNQISYVSIFMANIVSKVPLVPAGHTGFGFLVPKSSNNKEFLLGTIFDSDIAANVQPLFKSAATDNSSGQQVSNITMMLGGHFYTSNIPSTTLSLKAVKTTLEKVFGLDLSEFNIIIRDEANATDTNINLQPNDIVISYNFHADCIPQYNVGYEDIKQRVHQLLPQSKMSMGGMCFGKGVGVPDCVLNSLEDALKLELK